MTREEERHEAAKKFAFSDKTETTDFYNVMNDFYYGALWADENPKRYSQEELCDIQLEMMKQRDKRLLDKTCEWLKNTIDDDVLVKCGSVIKCLDVDDFVLYFRKAMEE